VRPIGPVFRRQIAPRYCLHSSACSRRRPRTTYPIHPHLQLEGAPAYVLVSVFHLRAGRPRSARRAKVRTLQTDSVATGSARLSRSAAIATSMDKRSDERSSSLPQARRGYAAPAAPSCGSKWCDLRPAAGPASSLEWIAHNRVPPRFPGAPRTLSLLTRAFDR